MRSYLNSYLHRTSKILWQNGPKMCERESCPGWDDSITLRWECGEEGGVSLRRASRVFKLSIATLFARRIIDQGINYVRNVPPNYAMRRCSRILRPRKTAQSASFQCLRDWYVASRFHPRLYHLYQFTTLRLQMWSWQQRRLIIIIRAAVRAFVEGAFTPSISLEILISVHFAIPTGVAKQTKKWSERWWSGWK